MKSIGESMLWGASVGDLKQRAYLDILHASSGRKVV